ncbi:hypothetical protein [Pontibacillus salipaludis]|uniref:Uncharacterized protein n=1 Tax=Pontibacillus salipaludis TaxID=1697394 RepID=A0ABQ1Q1B0_9BACI|nr:hypothetical protein [Pontibacillus salipaludis]GGD09585.1 hypothetical protein GCM10011389_16400 [Pontibacillus salipaludis]
MKKFILLTSVTAFGIMLFLGGYFVGINSPNEASREIRFGHQNSEHPNRVDDRYVFTDVENQTIIDTVMMIYVHKKPIENANVNEENPDLYMSVMSPRKSVGLIDARIWFTSDGAIIGERNGESWSEVEYYEMDESEAAYIKGIVEYGVE